MNNKELEQIGESVWDTYKKLATCLVERRKLPAAPAAPAAEGSNLSAAEKQKKRERIYRIVAAGNQPTESST